MTAVLMYHGLGDRPADHGELRYTVDLPTLERQLDALAAGGRVVSLEQMLKGRGGRGAVVLTFDDGERSVLEGLDPMGRRGFTGTLFMTSGWVGRPGYLTADDLRRLQGAGWTIGAHGVTHRYLSSLDDQQLKQELCRAREGLSQLLGREVRHMSLPGGRADARVVAACRRAGYHSLCTSRVGLNPPRPPAFALRRAMVLRHHGQDTYRGLALGRRSAYARLRARQLLLDGSKQLLGDGFYDRLRARVVR